MGSSDLEGMTNKIGTYGYGFHRTGRLNIHLAAQNLKTRGMCPIQDIAYPDPKGANAGSIERNRLNIEPAQVIYFVSHHCPLDHYPDLPYYIL